MTGRKRSLPQKTPRASRRTRGSAESNRARRKSGARRPKDEFVIRLANEQSHVAFPAARLRRLCAAVLDAEAVAAADLSVALVDNATIHALNREHLRHDYATDVLSFLFDSVAEPSEKGGTPRLRRIDGEVVASAEMAVQTAASFGWSARDELSLYLVHGLLHLCGYDDVTPAKRREMRARERTILDQLGIRATSPVPASRSRPRGKEQNGI